MKQNVEVCGQERIQVDERFLVEVRVVVARVLQLGVVPQPLPMLVEEPFQRRLAVLGLAEESPVTDLLDVAGFEVDLNREPVLELV